MTWLNNRSLRVKMLIPVLLITATLVGVAAVGIVSLNQVAAVNKLVTHTYLPSVDYLVEADRDLQQALVAERSMIFIDVASDQFKELVKDHDENVTGLSRQVGKNHKRSGFPARRRHADRPPNRDGSQFRSCGEAI